MDRHTPPQGRQQLYSPMEMPTSTAVYRVHIPMAVVFQLKNSKSLTYVSVSIRFPAVCHVGCHPLGKASVGRMHPGAAFLGADEAHSVPLEGHE